MKLYPVGWFKKPSKSFQLFSGTNRGDGGRETGAGLSVEDDCTPDFDEMVYVDGKQVVWSSGSGGAQRIYKSYRQVLNAKQALLCSFVGVGKTDDIKSLGVTGDSHVGDSQPAQANAGSNLYNSNNATAGEGEQQQEHDGGPSGESLDDRCLCVLQGLECVKIYAPDGAEFEVALPCKAARMWALPRGLLIERAVQGGLGEDGNMSESDDDENNETGNRIEIDERGIAKPAAEDVPSPMFFSLLHPLEELKPVSYTISPSEVNESDGANSNAMDSHGGGKFSINLPEQDFQLSSSGNDDFEIGQEDVTGEFMCDSRERILFVDKDLCLVVTYHGGTKSHSVWCLLPATAVNATNNKNSSEGKKNRTNDNHVNGNFGRGAQGMDMDMDMDLDMDIDQETATTSSEYDEDEDDVIESEVFMQKIWTGEQSDQADSVFVSHDQEGIPLICIMHHETCLLKGLSIKTESRNNSTFASPVNLGESSSILQTPLPSLVKSVPRDRIIVELAFEMKVKAAQPVLGTGAPPILDMVIVTLNDKLELYRGNTRLCELEIASDKIPPKPFQGLSNLRSSSSGSRNSNNNNNNKDQDSKKKQLVQNITKLEHAVTNRVNLVFSDESSLRVTTTMGFHSRILRPCLQGIDYALPADLSLRLRVDVAFWYDKITHSKDPQIHKLVTLLVGEQGLAKSGTRVDLEWAAFVIVIGLLLHRAGGKPITDSRPISVESNDEENDGNWFNRMMSSDFHQEFQEGNRQTLQFLNRNTDKSSSYKDKEQVGLENWFTIISSESSIHMISDSERFKKNIGVFLLCLHLVYEECKLSTLTWPLVRPLACILSGLVQATLDEAGGKNYLDHYARDLGKLEPVPLPHFKDNERVQISKQDPPNLFDWLAKRMAKASEKYRSNMPANQAASRPLRPEEELIRNVIGLSATSATMRPFPELESCFRTQQICCFLELLSGGTGDDATVAPLEFRLNKENKQNRATSKSPVMSAFVAMDSSFSHWMNVHGYEARNAAERTVLGMVWFGFTLQELETLTFGLSIPLRQALHFCRANPSGRWPADAYVLVGREDMAALALAPPSPPISTYLPLEEHEFSVSSSFSSSSSNLIDQQKHQQQQQQLNAVTPHQKQNNEKLLKTPAISRVQQQDPLLSSKSRTSKSKRRSSESWNTITTAVTPVWRRVPSGQGVANQVAEDILWGGQSSKKSSKRSGKNTFLQQHQQHGQKVASSTATSRLLSIADFARLSASASAEVGGLSTGDDLFSFESDGSKSGGGASSGNDGHKSGTHALNDPSGFGLLQRMTTLRFGSDRRIREVCRILKSSAPVRLVVERGPETSDHELVAAQQAKLLLISRRTLALPVGRGMITFGTVRPLLTDTVDIPSISLAGKIPPNNAIVKLDLSAVSNGDELLAWPRFHNGAAAGLRLSAGRQVTPLTRTWIAYNRPETPNHTHAGYLLALGLHGHLAALTMADIYEYLAQGHDATTVAIMLGLSAAKRATMAPTVSKMLCLHIPSLLPPAFSDMEVPSVVQTSAIMGVGLLYQGTAHRLMTEFLLAEIGRRPTSDRVIDRESYSLAAGLALGFVTLGFGSKPGGLSGLADLRLEDRLHRYMVGGLDPEYSTANNPSSSASDPTKCSRVREGPYVNVNVTSPGATLALAFIFIKSGNDSVAARLAIPDTHFLLDYVRPDLLMLRVMARNLVLWDNVEPTEEWLVGQVPPAIRFSFERLAGGGTTAAAVAAATKVHAKHAHTADEDDEIFPADEKVADEYEDEDDDQDLDLVSDSDATRLPQDRVESSTSSSSTSFTSPRTERRRRSMSHGGVRSRTKPSKRIARLKKRGNSMASMASKVTSIGEDSDGKPRRNTGVPVDEQAVKLAHANIIAGACFSIGLRFVGTASKSAQKVLMKYVRHFVKLRTCDKDSFLAKQRPDKSTLEMCLGASAIALALVMAGTGDLETLRLLRSLRFHSDETVTYGNHMAIGSAIGILFLGGGRVSFSNDNASIAALVCSFFPRFPLHTNDNQYHLQALRHLYVLATEQRCLDCFDIDSRSPCFLPMEITLRENAFRYYADRSECLNQESGGAAGFYSKTSTKQRRGKFVKLPAHLTTPKSIMKVVAPCLLPPLAWISSIRVSSPRYWPVEIHLDGEKNIAQKIAIAAYRVICVKRKVGHLSYLEDPQGVSSLLARPRLKLMGFEDGSVSTEFMRTFTADPHVLAFAEHFCSKSASDNFDDQFVSFCTATLYDCLTHEKPEMLNAMVDLYQTARVFKSMPHSFHTRNVHLLCSFYRLSPPKDHEEDPLISRGFLESLRLSFAKYVNVFDAYPKLLRHYLTSLEFPPESVLRNAMKREIKSGEDGNFGVIENANVLFAMYLHYHEIPPAHALATFDVDDLKDVFSFATFALNHKSSVSPKALLKMHKAMMSSSSSSSSIFSRDDMDLE